MQVNAIPGAGIRRFLASVLVSFAVSNSASAQSWVEVKVPHFTVLSDSGIDSARDMARQFEDVRTALLTVWPWTRADLDRPVKVFAVRNEEGLTRFAPGVGPTVGSYAIEGPDGHYIVVRTDSTISAANPYRLAFGAYILTVLNATSSRPLPTWFALGIAEVMSTTATKDASIEVGRPIPEHVRTLRITGHFSPAALTGIRAGNTRAASVSPAVFSASSWAFAHLLLYGEDFRYRAALDHYWKLLMDGTHTPQAAFTTAFGRFGTVDDLDVALRNYLSKSRWPFVTLSVDRTSSAYSFSARSVADNEFAGLLAHVLAASGHPNEAKSELQRVTTDPASIAVHEAEGMVADLGRDTSAALTAYSKAIGLGSEHFYSHLRWAVLNRERADTDWAAVTDALERARSLNPRYGTTHRVLGEVLWQRGLHDDAVISLQRAVAVAPGDTESRQELVRMLVAAGRPAEATAIAAEAGLTVPTPAEVAMQPQELVRQLAARLAASRVGASGVAQGAVSGLPEAPPPPPPPPPNGRIRVGGDIPPPARTKHVPPVYPPSAASARVQGAVVVEATIGVDGKIEDARVHQSVPLLDAAALTAVKQWEYTPTRLNGVPVPVIMTITVQFALTDSDPSTPPSAASQGSTIDLGADDPPTLQATRSSDYRFLGLRLGLTQAEALNIVKTNSRLLVQADVNNPLRLYVYGRNADGTRGPSLLYLIWEQGDASMRRMTVFQDSRMALAPSFQRLLTLEAVDDNSAFKKRFLGDATRTGSREIPLARVRQITHYYDKIGLEITDQRLGEVRSVVFALVAQAN